MPALPWTTIGPPPPSGDVLVLASRLVLPSHRMVPGFMRSAMQVHAATKLAAGAVGATLLAQPASRTFWTMSAWTDEDAMRRFVRDPVHRAVMQRYGGRLAAATFTTWTAPAKPLPPSWDEAKARVAAAVATR